MGEPSGQELGCALGGVCGQFGADGYRIPGVKFSDPKGLCLIQRHGELGSWHSEGLLTPSTCDPWLRPFRG